VGMAEVLSFVFDAYGEKLEEMGAKNA